MFLVGLEFVLSAFSGATKMRFAADRAKECLVGLFQFLLGLEFVRTLVLVNIVEWLVSCTSWRFDFHLSRSEITLFISLRGCISFVARGSNEPPRPVLDGHYCWRVKD